MTLNDLFKILKEANIDAPQKTLDVLTAFVLGIEESEVVSRRLMGRLSLDEKQLSALYELVKQRISGVPLQYITGTCDFYGLRFKTRPNVLIPRPDTEILVEQALKFVEDGYCVLDLCTGTGCIGISLATERAVFCTLADINEDALALASENARDCGVSDRVRVINHNVFSDTFSEKFSLIVSNPPYIPTGDIQSLDIEVQNEPHSALDGGSDGLDFYRTITERYKDNLFPGGALMFELGIGQADDVAAIFEKNGYSNIKMQKDYNNIIRVISAVKA